MVEMVAEKNYISVDRSLWVILMMNMIGFDK